MAAATSNGKSATMREQSRHDIGVLEQRVYGVEQSLHAISSQIGALGSKIEERAKIPWPALGVMLSFLTIVGGLVWYPVKTNQDRLETAIIKIADNVPTNREIDANAKRRDDWQKQTEERFTRTETAQESHQKQIVPRGEHEEKWRSADLRFSEVQRQIDGLKKEYSDLYSPRDALTTMQRRIENLEQKQRAN